MRGATAAIVALLLLAPAHAAPEHAEIAFVSDGRIWAARADGGERRPLGRGSEPLWSRDGSRLAAIQGDRLTVEGRPVTPRRRGFSESSPAWSPDGTAIAFGRFIFSGDDYRTQIVVRELGTGTERVLVSVDLFPRFDAVGRLDWSPDGSTIAYTHSRIDAEYDIRPHIRTVPAAGGASRLLIRDAQSPAWSPDGGRLAFASVQDRNGKLCSSDECWFAGEIYTRGRLLTDTGRARHVRFLAYDDCTRFDGCPATIELTGQPACRASLPRRPRHRFRMRGAVVVWDGHETAAYVHSGDAVTGIRTGDRNTLARVRRIVRDLRPYGAADARGRLKPPRLLDD